VLISAAAGKKDAANLRLSGRARDGRLVHVAPGETPIGPGDVVTARISYAAPHHLVADGPILAHRRWRAAAGAAAGVGAGQPAGRLLSIGRRPG